MSFRYSCAYPACENTYTDDDPGKYCSVACKNEHKLYGNIDDRRLDRARKEVDDFLANSDCTIAEAVEAMCESLNGTVSFNNLDNEVTYSFTFPRR